MITPVELSGASYLREDKACCNEEKFSWESVDLKIIRIRVSSRKPYHGHASVEL